MKQFVLIFFGFWVLSGCTPYTTSEQFRAYLNNPQNGLSHKFILEGQTYHLSYLPSIFTNSKGDMKRYFKLRGDNIFYRFSEEDFSIENETKKLIPSVVVPENDGLGQGEILVIGFPADAVSGDFVFKIRSAGGGDTEVAKFKGKSIQNIEKIRLK